QAEDGIRDGHVTGVQTCALPIFLCLQCAELRSNSMLGLALPHTARNFFMYWNELAGGAAQGPRGLCRRRRRIPSCPGANQPIESLAGSRCGVTCPVLASATRIH